MRSRPVESRKRIWSYTPAPATEQDIFILKFQATIFSAREKVVQGSLIRQVKQVGLNRFQFAMDDIDAQIDSVLARLFGQSILIGQFLIIESPANATDEKSGGKKQEQQPPEDLGRKKNWAVAKPSEQRKSS